ncbi:hypothetical protein [Acholeplasma laidlawii]|uniref:hypothetical protein n=1 Tax=Acholeplasma laidlawii TaxID=2148 RepID=UPI0021F6AC34|nr:hypothetical protein [Acholeplasma laidlawii]
MDIFLKQLKSSSPETEGQVFKNLLDEYEKVILRSLVTTFGLDRLIVKDQHGGDVDTLHHIKEQQDSNIHNKVNSDEKNTMKFKNPKYDEIYRNSPKYDSIDYHSDKRYKDLISENRYNPDLEDTYISGHKIFYGNSNYRKHNHEKQASLDHVVSASEIHNDARRIILGLDGKELANSPENLKFTNAKLNTEKSNMTMDEFLTKNESNYSQSQKEKMKQEDFVSRSKIDNIYNDTYYTSPDFYNDMLKASNNLGVKTGIIEMVGFIFVEIVFSCMNEMKQVSNNKSVSEYLGALKNGIEKGIENIKKNHKYLFTVFKEGYVSGVIASITTTLINIFITTKAIFVRQIRIVITTVIKALDVLLYNPQNLLLGDRFKYTTVILTTGVSSIIGTSVENVLSKNPTILPPLIYREVKRFTGILTTGLLSCTFLYLMDRSNTVNKITNYFNRYVSPNQNLAYYSLELKKAAAIINNYDISGFLLECEQFEAIANKIMNIENEDDFEELMDEILNDSDEKEGIYEDFLDGSKKNFII